MPARPEPTTEELLAAWREAERQLETGASAADRAARQARLERAARAYHERITDVTAHGQVEPDDANRKPRR